MFGFDFFSLLFPALTLSFAEGVGKLMEYNYTSVNLIFSNTAIKQLILLIYSLGAGLYVGGVGLAFSQWAIDSKEGNAETVMNTIKNVFIGLIAVNCFTSIPVLLLKFTDLTAQTIASASIDDSLVNLAKQIGDGTVTLDSLWDSGGAFWNIIYIIVVFVAVVKVFFANIKRGGILIAQMAVGALHMFSVPRGLTDAFYSWCKQVAGLCLTAFLQNIFVVTGLLIFTASASSSLPTMIASAGMVMAASEIPRILQQFGLDTSMRASFTQAVFATNGITSIIRSVVH